MHQATSVGPWGPSGVRRQVRSTIASGLTAVAAVLSAASSLAETIANELRLTLDDEALAQPVQAAPAADGGAPSPSGPAAAPTPDDTAADEPTVRIVDVASRRADGGSEEPVPSAPPPWVDDVAAEVASGTVREAVARLATLTPTQLRALERHERAHRQRVTLLRAVDEELAHRG